MVVKMPLASWLSSQETADMFAKELIEADCIQTDSKCECRWVVPGQMQLMAERFQEGALTTSSYSSKRPRVIRQKLRES